MDKNRRNKYIKKTILQIVDYYNKQKYSLCDGNCGMFALALAHLFQKEDVQFVLATDCEDEDGYECNVWHVIISINNVWYDYSGVTNEEKLNQFVIKDCEQRNGFYTHIIEPCYEIRESIAANTGWWSRDTEFLADFQMILGRKRPIKRNKQLDWIDGERRYVNFKEEIAA